MNSNNPLAVEPETENDAGLENCPVTFSESHFCCSGGWRDNDKDFLK
jgi:hypothetical protein